MTPAENVRVYSINQQPSVHVNGNKKAGKGHIKRISQIPAPQMYTPDSTYRELTGQHLAEFCRKENTCEHFFEQNSSE